MKFLLLFVGLFAIVLANEIEGGCIYYYVNFTHKCGQEIIFKTGDTFQIMINKSILRANLHYESTCPKSSDEFEEARLALQNPDLYDGDIIGIDGPFDAERNAIPGDSYRWPNAVVPYVIDSSLSLHKSLIEEGFKNYHDNTCVRFVPRTNENDFIRIFSGKGCSSAVGKVRGQQDVSLGRGCLYVGTIVHELGHALGFYHEQNRSDRDNFLQIFLHNVQQGRDFNFFKLSPTQNILYNTFDYNSIMIYGNKAFSKNGKDTMVARNGQELFDPYHKQGMTSSDIQRVRKMYQC